MKEELQSEEKECVRAVSPSQYLARIVRNVVDKAGPKTVDTQNKVQADDCVPLRQIRSAMAVLTIEMQMACTYDTGVLKCDFIIGMVFMVLSLKGRNACKRTVELHRLCDPHSSSEQQPTVRYGGGIVPASSTRDDRRPS